MELEHRFLSRSASCRNRRRRLHRGSSLALRRCHTFGPSLDNGRKSFERKAGFGYKDAMAFWSTQKIRAEQRQLGNLILPFDSNRVQQGAYELALSREVITAPPAKGPRYDGIGPALEIPSGEFALLYTQETITIPPAVIAFISIKAAVKFDGLVNVSGFHVDPGFSGRLKFSVYNAGNESIFLDYEREAFLIWFADLDAPTIEPYHGSHQNQDRITPRDRQRMSKRSYAPAALDQRLKKVEEKIRWFFIVCGAVATGIIIPVFIVPLFKVWLAKPISPNSTKRQNPAASSSPSASVAGGRSLSTSTPQTSSIATATPVQPAPTIVPGVTPLPSVTVSPAKAPQP
jgi:dCTP deaminase